MSKLVIHFSLPTLSNNHAKTAQNAISMQLGILVSQQQQFYHQDEQRRHNEKSTPTKKRIEPQNVVLLLKLYGVTIPANSKPIWRRLTNARKPEKLATIQATFYYYKNQIQ